MNWRGAFNGLMTGLISLGIMGAWVAMIMFFSHYVKAGWVPYCIAAGFLIFMVFLGALTP